MAGGSRRRLRTALAFALVLAWIQAGHFIRDFLLTDDQGRWLPALAAMPAAEDSDQPRRAPRPHLTGPVDINRAPVDTLILLPRVGPVLAARIAAARDSGLVFRCPADLRQVRGIGPRLAASLDTLLVYPSSRQNRN